MITDSMSAGAAPRQLVHTLMVGWSMAGSSWMGSLLRLTAPRINNKTTTTTTAAGFAIDNLLRFTAPSLSLALPGRGRSAFGADHGLICLVPGQFVMRRASAPHGG